MLAAATASTSSTNSVSVPLNNNSHPPSFSDRRRVGKKRHLFRRLAQDDGLDIEEETLIDTHPVGSSKKRARECVRIGSAGDMCCSASLQASTVRPPSESLPKKAEQKSVSGGESLTTECNGSFEDRSSVTASSFGVVGGDYRVNHTFSKIPRIERVTPPPQRNHITIPECREKEGGPVESVSDNVSFTSESDEDLEVLEEGVLPNEVKEHFSLQSTSNEKVLDHGEENERLSISTNEPTDLPIKKLRLILRLGKVKQDELGTKERELEGKDDHGVSEKEEKDNFIPSPLSSNDSHEEDEEDSESEFNRSLREVEAMEDIRLSSEQMIKKRKIQLATVESCTKKKSKRKHEVVHNKVTRGKGGITSSEEEEWEDNDVMSKVGHDRKRKKKMRKLDHSNFAKSSSSTTHKSINVMQSCRDETNGSDYSSEHEWDEENELKNAIHSKKKKDKKKKKKRQKRKKREKREKRAKKEKKTKHKIRKQPNQTPSSLNPKVAVSKAASHNILKSVSPSVKPEKISSLEGKDLLPKIHIHIPLLKKFTVQSDSSSSEEEWDENDTNSVASSSYHGYLSDSLLSEVLSPPSSSVPCMIDHMLRPYSIVMALTTPAAIVVYPQTHLPNNIPRSEDEIQTVHRNERVLLKLGRGQLIIFDGGLIHGGRGRGWGTFNSGELGISSAASSLPDEGPCVRAHFYLEPAQRKGVGQFGNPAAKVVGAPDLRKDIGGVSTDVGFDPLDMPNYKRNRGGDVESRQLHRETNTRGDQVIATCRNAECNKCAIGVPNRFRTRYGAYKLSEGCNNGEGGNDPGEFMVDCSQMSPSNGRPSYVAGDLRSEGWAVFDTCNTSIVTEEDLERIPKNAWDKIFNEEKEMSYTVENKSKPQAPPPKNTSYLSPNRACAISKIPRQGRRLMCKLNPCLNHYVANKRGRNLLVIQKRVERHVGDLGFNEYEMVVNDAALLMTELGTTDQRPHRDFSRFLLLGER